MSSTISSFTRTRHQPLPLVPPLHPAIGPFYHTSHPTRAAATFKSTSALTVAPYALGCTVLLERTLRLCRSVACVVLDSSTIYHRHTKGPACGIPQGSPPAVSLASCPRLASCHSPTLSHSFSGYPHSPLGTLVSHHAILRCTPWGPRTGDDPLPLSPFGTNGEPSCHSAVYYTVTNEWQSPAVSRADVAQRVGAGVGRCRTICTENGRRERAHNIRPACRTRCRQTSHHLRPKTGGVASYRKDGGFRRWLA